MAIILISLDHIRPFSPDANAVVERLTFKLCPVYVLGFTNFVSSNAALVVLTILGNALLYGAVFGGIAAILSAFKRSAV